MANFWKLVNRIIAQSDIILEVADARFLNETRNPEIEEKIVRAKKRFIIVANKADLTRERRRDIPNLVYVSAKNKLGSSVLKRKLLEVGHGKEIVVGVVGYPNTGKSSVINSLTGKKKAPTSSQSGYTRSLRKCRASGKIMLFDTPGVIDFRKNDEITLALFGSVDANQLKDPIGTALVLVERMKDNVRERYKVEGEEAYELLENVARKMNMLQSGGVPDERRAAIRIISDWQQGL